MRRRAVGAVGAAGAASRTARSTAGRSPAIVFADPAERAALEGMVFPYIRAAGREEIAAAQADPACRFVVLDAAVMLEAGWDDGVRPDRLRGCPAGAALARLAARSGWTDADLAAREAAQWPAEEKKARADAVLVNDASPAELQETGRPTA